MKKNLDMTQGSPVRLRAVAVGAFLTVLLVILLFHLGNREKKLMAEEKS